MYNYKEEKRVTTQHCEAKGCHELGEYRAPKWRGEQPEYFWFCLDHVREYNKSWDYFAGMTQDQIEAFQKDALRGHRPTWSSQLPPMEYAERLYQAAQEFFGNGFYSTQQTKGHSKYRRAYDVLGLEITATFKDIKKQYKILVKKYHPDLNQGDPAAEEQFKRVTEAYHLLAEQYKEARPS